MPLAGETLQPTANVARNSEFYGASYQAQRNPTLPATMRCCSPPRLVEQLTEAYTLPRWENFATTPASICAVPWRFGVTMDVLLSKVVVSLLPIARSRLRRT